MTTVVKKLDLLHILVTKQCNLDCLHCYVNASPHKDNDELTLEEFEKLSEDVSELNVRGLHIEGGEPLMHPNIDEIVGYFDSPEDVLIASNGLLINDSILRNLKGTKLSKIVISVDGATKQTQKNIRHCNLDDVLKNVNLVKKYDFNVQMSSVLTATNYKEIPQLINLASDMRVDRLDMNFFERAGRGVHHPEFDLGESEWKEIDNLIMKSISEKKSRIDSLYVGVSTPLYLKDKLEITRKENLKGTKICDAGEKQAIITPQGWIAPCYIYADYPEHYIENIRQKSLTEIWNSEKLQAWIKKYRQVSCPAKAMGHNYSAWII